MPRVLIALVFVASAYPTFILLLGGEYAKFGALMVGFVTGGVSLIAGVPLAIWFVKRSWFKLWQSLIAGALIGISVGFIFNTFIEFSDILVFVLKYAALGCLHTATFWVLAFWKNHAFIPMASRKAQSTNAA